MSAANDRGFAMPGPISHRGRLRTMGDLERRKYRVMKWLTGPAVNGAPCPSDIANDIEALCRAAVRRDERGGRVTRVDPRLWLVRQFLLDEYRCGEAEAEGFPVSRPARPAWDALHEFINDQGCASPPCPPIGDMGSGMP